MNRIHPDVPTLTENRLLGLRENWRMPDRDGDHNWMFDGYYPKYMQWMSYDHEMADGLMMFECKSFDDLILQLSRKLNRKPNVIDLMGGAYFLNYPENVNSITGIRAVNKDNDFSDFYSDRDDDESSSYKRIINSENRSIIEADILSVEGWKIIKQAGIPLADILVCRPVGPFNSRTSMISKNDSPSNYTGLYISLFNRMLRLVNKKGGIIFTELPDIYSNPEIEKFFIDIREKNNLSTNTFTVSNSSFQFSEQKRRYAVIQFGI